jgi:hypothetical protein
VDGGITDLNPSKIALREAVELWPDQKLVLVSLGCGKQAQVQSKKVKGALNHFTNTFMKMLQTLTDVEKIHLSLCDTISGMKNSNIEYFRLNPDDLGSIQLDEHRDEVLEFMEGETELYCEKESQTFDYLCNLLGCNVLQKAATLFGEPSEFPYIQVKVRYATDLLISDLNGFSDPYVTIICNKKEQKTRVIKKNLNPKWYQTFKFYVSPMELRSFHENKELFMEFNVYDEDKLKKDDFLGFYLFFLNFIGSCEMNVVGLPCEEKIKKSFTLEDTPHGELFLEFVSHLWKMEGSEE